MENILTKDRFIEQLSRILTIGSIFENPGGGTSVISSIGEDKLSYIRGTSRIYLPYAAIIDVLKTFAGKVTTTNELKEYNPLVFDSKRNGHSCNCTAMFCILERMGLTDGGIKGSGSRGSPFFIKISKVYK